MLSRVLEEWGTYHPKEERWVAPHHSKKKRTVVPHHFKEKRGPILRSKRYEFGKLLLKERGGMGSLKASSRKARLLSGRPQYIQMKGKKEVILIFFSLVLFS